MLGIENDSIIELAETFMDRPQTFDMLVVDLRSGSGIQVNFVYFSLPFHFPNYLINRNFA